MAYIAFFKNAMSCLNYILRGSEDHNIPPKDNLWNWGISLHCCSPRKYLRKIWILQAKNLHSRSFCLYCQLQLASRVELCTKFCHPAKQKKYKPNDCIFWVGGKKVDDDFTAVWDVAGIWYWKKSEQIMVFKQPVSEPCLVCLLKKRSMKVLYQSLKSQTEMFNFKT